VPFHGNGWNPNTITRAVKGFTTATRTVRVDTDLGEGFLKALGNPEGPHALACELVGSLCADWLGLKTFDFALIRVTDPDEVSLMGERWAQPGPAFISRAEDMGFTWGGDAQTISAVVNRGDLSRLVVLDSWLRNCDRHAPDGRRINRKNVFLMQRTQPQRQLELIAMDFTHAFTCGNELDRRLGYIEKIRDEAVFGLFDEFKAHLSREVVIETAARLMAFDSNLAELFISRVPTEWSVDGPIRSVWKRFLVDRAHFCADTIERRLWPETDDLPYPGGLE
jgi:hypothetical protein